MRYLVVIVLVLFASCNRSESINTDINTEDISDTTKSEIAPEKLPERIIENLYIRIDSNSKYSEGYFYTIDKIIVYEEPNTTAANKEITDLDVLLFHIDQFPNWLFLLSNDNNYSGFINVKDITKSSYYGDFSSNDESGNYYLNQLNEEYLKLDKIAFIKRYGPLLEITKDGLIYRIWDDFGEYGYKYTFTEQISDNYLLLQEQHYEGGNYILYDLTKGEIVAALSNYPVFTTDFSKIICCGFIYGDGFAYEILEKVNDKYERTFYFNDFEIMPDRGEIEKEFEAGWIHNEFCKVVFSDMDLITETILLKTGINKWDYSYVPINFNNYASEEQYIVERFSEFDSLLFNERENNITNDQQQYKIRLEIITKARELYEFATHRM